MGTTMNRVAFAEMIEQDIAEMRKWMPHSLEFDHIENILRDSIRVYYACPHCSALAAGRGDSRHDIEETE